MIVSLSHVAEINPKADLPAYLAQDEMLDFLPMADVSETGKVSVTTQRPLSEVQKGFTAFRRGDILIAKITPCFENNKIAVADIATEVGFGSTEFHVVRCDQSRLDGRYVLHLLRSNDVRVEGKKRMTGSAGQQRVPKKFLEDLQIPLPPLEEQKRIAAILDQADELRRKRQRALDRLNQLGQAIFIEMFGDPASNPMGWPKVSLADCCAEQDDIRCGPFGTQLLREEFQETGVPLWGIKQVNRAFSIPTHEYVTPSKAKELSNYDVVADDIVMTRKGTIGNCAVYPQSFPPGVMHSDLLRVRLDRSRAAPQFIADQLHYSRDVERQIELISGGAIMQGINVGKLKRISVLLPPMSLQANYAARMTEVALQASALKDWRRRGDALFAAIQHRAFRGELTASSLKEAAA